MRVTFFITSIFLLEISFSHQFMFGPPKWKAKKDNTSLITEMFDNYVELKCPAHGNPKPNITWYRNDQLIDRNTTIKKYRLKRWKLQIKPVNLNDNGNYTCVVENEYGKITWTYQLKLGEGPPKWSSSKDISEIVTEMPFNSARLNCVAYGFPKPNITWFKNGKLIVGNTKNKYRTSKGTLKIKSLDIIDFGNYTCVVQNEHGRLTWTYQLRVDDVRAGTPRFIEHLYNEPPIGGRVDLGCYVIRPDIRPQWVKHHEVNGSMLGPHGAKYIYLLPSSPTKQHNVAVFSLLNLTMEDRGFYSCIAPYHGRWIYKSIYIYLEDESGSGPGKPVFQMPRYVLKDAFENGRKRLKCKVKGNPKPSVQWYKDGVAISMSKNKRYRITKTALIINPVKKSDAGVFKCRAWNSVGSKSHSYTVKVIPAIPVIDGTYHTKFLAVKKRSIAFGCKVQGHPRPTITWYKDGVVIPPKFNKRYNIRREYMEITKLKKTDTGGFMCFTRNKNGNARRIFSLLVVSESDYNDTQDSYERCDDVTEGAPQWNKPKTKPQIIIRKTYESVELDCHACGNPEPNIVWYKDQEYLNSSILTEKYTMEARNRKLKIINLRTNDNGDYTCIAENQHGRILRLHTLRVKKNPPKLLGPGNTTAIAGTSITLECLSENSFEVPHVQWMKYYQENGAYETLSGTPYLTIIQVSALNQTEPHLLRFANVTKDDAGSYVCQVSNAGGVSSRRFWLTVVDDLVA